MLFVELVRRNIGAGAFFLLVGGGGPLEPVGQTPPGDPIAAWYHVKRRTIFLFTRPYSAQGS